MINLNEEWRLEEKDCGWVILNSIDELRQVPMDIFEKVKFMQIKPYVSIALACADIVYPIYHAKYPEDTRVIDCIKATKLYLVDKVSREELNKAAAAADAAVYAAHAAVYAADAAVYAADGAYAAYTTVYDAADAAYDAADTARAAADATKINWFQEWLDD